MNFELVLVSSQRDIQNTKRLRNWQKEGQIHTIATHKGIKCIAMDGLKSQANQLLKDKESLSGPKPIKWGVAPWLSNTEFLPSRKKHAQKWRFFLQEEQSQSQLRKI